METVKRYSIISVGLLMASLFGSQMTYSASIPMFDTTTNTIFSYSPALTTTKESGTALRSASSKAIKMGSKACESVYQWSKQNPHLSKPIGGLMTLYSIYKIGPKRIWDTIKRGCSFAWNTTIRGLNLARKTTSLITRDIITPAFLGILILASYAILQKELTLNNITATVTVLDTQAHGLHEELEAANKAGAKAQELLVATLQKYGAALETNKSQQLVIDALGQAVAEKDQRLLNPQALPIILRSLRDMLLPGAIASTGMTQSLK